MKQEINYQIISRFESIMKIKVALSTIETTKDEDKNEIIHLFGVDEDGYNHHIPVYDFKPYFYVESIEPIKRNPDIVKIVKMNDWETIYHKPIKKIIMKNRYAMIGDYDNQGYSHKYKNTYEADIKTSERFIIDKSLKSGFIYDDEIDRNTFDTIESCNFKSDLRRCHIDIETSTKESGGYFPSIKKPKNRIFCISCLDTYTLEFSVFIYHKKYKKNIITQEYTNPIEKAIKSGIRKLKSEVIRIKKEIKLIDSKRIRSIKEIEDIGGYGSEYTKLEYKYYSMLDKIKEIPKRIEQLGIRLKNNDKNFNKTYDVKIFTYFKEINMLKGFIKYIEEFNFSIRTGWNYKKFDEPYIIARCRYLHIKQVNNMSQLGSLWIDGNGVGHSKGTIIFDTMEGLKKMQTHKLPSYKLDSISKWLFEIGKIKHKGFEYEWKYRTSRLIKYNIQDVFLEYAIAEDQGIFEFFYGVKTYVGCSFEDVLDNARIMDNYLLIIARNKKIVLPTKVKREKSKKSEGAIVLRAPNDGLYEWIGVFDFASLYPNAIRTLNMGPDTKVLNPSKEDIPNLIKSPLPGVYYKKKKDLVSFLVSIIIELLDYRQEMKDMVKHYEGLNDDSNTELYDRIQTVVKFILNSIFGVLKYVGFRLYDEDVFNCIIQLSRIMTTFSIKIVEKLKYIIHYGDTDSIFVRMKGNTVKSVLDESNILAKQINLKYDRLKKIFNIDSHTMKIKIDEVFKTLLMVKKRDKKGVAKKRYAGVMTDNKTLVKGFNRSDMSTIGNKIMMDILDLIARNKILHVIPYIQEEIDKIITGYYKLEDIAFSAGISMAFSDYKVKNNRVKGAEWTNKHSYLWENQTNYGGGSKPKFMFMDRMKFPAVYDRIELVALDDDNELPAELIKCIDWDTHLEKTVKDKIESILNAVKINWDDIIKKKKNKKLSKY